VLDSGEPILSNRNTVDRGGFRTNGDAEKLAQDINLRRARYAGDALPPAAPVVKEPDAPSGPQPLFYGGLPVAGPEVTPLIGGGEARVADEVPILETGAAPLLPGAPHTPSGYPGLVAGKMLPYGTQALLPPGGEAGMPFADCCSLANGWVGSSGPPAANTTIAPVPFPTMPAGCNVGVKASGNFHHHAVVAQP